MEHSDEMVISSYETLRSANRDLDTMFSKLSNKGFYVQANAVSHAARSIRSERNALHPLYIAAKNRIPVSDG